MHRLFWLFGFAACLHGVPDDLPATKPTKPPVPEPVPVVPPDEPIAAGDRTVGPLDVDAPPIDELARRARNEADVRDSRRPMSHDDYTVDGAALQALAVFYPKAITGSFPRSVSTDPTSVGELTSRLRDHLVDRLGICVAPAGRPGIERSCARGAALPPSTGAPFEVSEPQPGTVHLIIRDFNGDPQGFASARAKLRKAKGIVLDLRGARGDDPRAVMPWLEELTGRSPLKPLRSIERPASADGYVAAYAARFLEHSRNRDVWSTFVGATPAASAHPAPPPIEILLGDGCEAACELVTRVLETYAGATAYGHVRDLGRLAYDEPALLVLPRAKDSVYFFATSYWLAPEIEAATGPSDGWHRRHAQAFGIDDAVVSEFADRDVAQRRNGPWPRCTALPYVREPKLLSPAVFAKIPNAAKWDHGCVGDIVIVKIHARAPAELVLDILNSCGLEKFHFGGGGKPGTFLIDTSRTFPFGVLAQLAAHPLVDSVELECPAQGHWD